MTTVPVPPCANWPTSKETAIEPGAAPLVGVIAKPGGGGGWNRAVHVNGSVPPLLIDTVAVMVRGSSSVPMNVNWSGVTFIEGGVAARVARLAPGRLSSPMVRERRALDGAGSAISKIKTVNTTCRV
jgi:hypothetical protein